MSAQTREVLYQEFSDNQTATRAKFADLIDSFKMIQTAVSDPAASGTSVTFIATISQDTNGQITVTKKTVNFAGYQTESAMSVYQTNDLQQVGTVNVDGTGVAIDTHVNHGMKHYPTVRVINSSGQEISRDLVTVVHESRNAVRLTIDGSLNVSGASYEYILD